MFEKRNSFIFRRLLQQNLLQSLIEGIFCVLYAARFVVRVLRLIVHVQMAPSKSGAMIDSSSS